VEELAVEAELVRAPVERVAGDGQVDRGKVDADLVRPARLEANVEQRVAREQLRQLELRDRLPRDLGVERVPQRIAAVAADRRLDPPPAGARPADDER
jgi:hypothetical protein